MAERAGRAEQDMAGQSRQGMAEQDRTGQGQGRTGQIDRSIDW